MTYSGQLLAGLAALAMLGAAPAVAGPLDGLAAGGVGGIGGDIGGIGALGKLGVGNAAGLLGYCAKEGMADQVAKLTQGKLLGQLGGTEKAEKDPTYQDGLKGILSGEDNGGLSLATLKQKARQKMCGLVAKQALKMVPGL